jgi:large subunit ribosomal protein L15
MQINTLKLNGSKKKRKTVGRGGKKGTYSGRGNKGQKARSGGNVDPLFEGGRSTLIDHMKKKRGFTSLRPKKVVVKYSALSKKFESGAKITIDELVKSNFLSEGDVRRGVKILGPKSGDKKFSFEEKILLSKSVAGEQRTKNSEQ